MKPFLEKILFLIIILILIILPVISILDYNNYIDFNDTIISIGWGALIIDIFLFLNIVVAGM